MQKDQQKLAELIQGKKVAFIGAVSATRPLSRSLWSWGPM